MVEPRSKAETVGMRTLAEGLATRVVDLATAPWALAIAVVVLITVFSGLAGRTVLYLEIRAAGDISRY